MIWCIKTYMIAYIKIQRNKDILSIMSNLQPKNRFPKSWTNMQKFHDTKRRKDNQLQSPKLPCNIYKLSS